MSFCKYYSSRHFRYPRPKWRMDFQSSKRSDRSYQDLIHLNGLNSSNRSEYLNWETINYLMFYKQTELHLLHYCDTIQDKSKYYTKTLLSIKIRCRMNFIGSLMKQVWITTKWKNGFKIEEQKNEKMHRKYINEKFELYKLVRICQYRKVSGMFCYIIRNHCQKLQILQLFRKKHFIIWISLIQMFIQS